MKMIILSILMSAMPAIASDLAINYTRDNNLTLSAASCDHLLVQNQAICQWKKNINPSFELPEITKKSCRKVAKGYQISISTCLPDFVKENQNRINHKSGANCWGTALSFKRISKKPRFVWSSEIRYWQDSPLCRKLNPGEQKIPGDIINIYGPEYIFRKDETIGRDFEFWETLYPGRFTLAQIDAGYSGFHNFLHSETNVSDSLTFGKDSPSKDDRFKFNLINEVYGRSQDPECQENQNLSPHMREHQQDPKAISRSKCDYFSLAYRCENFESYFLKQKLTTEEMAISVDIDQLKDIQEKLFNLQMNSKAKLTPTELQEMLKLADEMSQESLSKLSSQLPKNTEMLLVLKFFTAAGIRKSLELADLIPATEAR